MKFSVIVSVYDKIDYLEIVLKSIFRQSYTDFEIIIAEDCSKEEMKKFIEKIKSENQHIKIKHVFQEDIGFRKNKILNEAIRNAEGEFLIFIEGDCILHKNFVKEYSKYSKVGRLVYGRRVYLSKVITKYLLKNKKLNILNPFSIILTGSRKLRYLFKIHFQISKIRERVY